MPSYSTPPAPHDSPALQHFYHGSPVQACESDRPAEQPKSPAVVSPSDSISIFSSSSSSSPGPSVHLPAESVEVQVQNSGSHCQQSVETEGEVSTTSSTYFYLRVRNHRKEEVEEQTANQRPVVSSSISTDISGVARPPEEEAEETGDEREVVPDETASEVATELHLSPVTLDRAEVTVTTRKR
ncbi:unnamed protein product [Dibothriocephalus latus]|uniref:Uncharacterized protein n=1 Tax=Dibothriocephalus latus TaxID=60516 RepID=A0A3P7ND98_DIBLA|nr:unnamed protein product [Dibothriocephalus latus]